MTNKNPFVKWVLHGIELPLHQNFIYWLSPTAALEQPLRAIWDAASQAAVLILPQIKLNSQLSSCTSFFLVKKCVDIKYKVCRFWSFSLYHTWNLVYFWNVQIHFFHNFWKFAAIISLNIFLCSCLSFFPLSSLLLEFPLCTCCPFWYCSTGLWGTNHFCFSVFHCFSECVVFISQFSSLWILLPVQSIYCTSLLYYLNFSYCIVHLTQNFNFFLFLISLLALYLMIHCCYILL